MKTGCERKISTVHVLKGGGVNPALAASGLVALEMRSYEDAGGVSRMKASSLATGRGALLGPQAFATKFRRKESFAKHIENSLQYDMDIQYPTRQPMGEIFRTA